MDVPSIVELHADAARAAQGLMQTKCPAFIVNRDGPDRLQRLASLQTEEAAISWVTLENWGSGFIFFQILVACVCFIC